MEHIRVVTSSEVLEQVNEKQISDFFQEFNKKMKDHAWVKAWRCGDAKESYWRFGISDQVNNATEKQLTAMLNRSGWRIIKVVRSYDRGHFTLFEVKAL